MANVDYSTDIKFSSVEEAVTKIEDNRKLIENELVVFERAVKDLIDNKGLVGKAAITFDESFEALKREKFDTFNSLIKDFATVIRTGKEATEDTAQAADADATSTLYKV